MEISLFGKFPINEVKCEDISVARYISIENHSYVPHSAGRWNAKRFHKARCPIVERLTNSIMMNGRNSGKKLLAARTVEQAFDLIKLMTGRNPIQVLVEAVSLGGPREDSCRVGRGGAIRRQAVDVSPIRRVNTAIFNIANGARNASFRKVKSLAECLADEIINAVAENEQKSEAIRQRNSIERIAVSNR